MEVLSSFAFTAEATMVGVAVSVASGMFSRVTIAVGIVVDACVIVILLLLLLFYGPQLWSSTIEMKIENIFSSFSIVKNN
jgi:hypothetical protein